MSYETYASFYRRYYRLVLTVAEQRLEGFSDAEDIAAEVFRVAWAHHDEGHPLTLPWLYQVLRHKIGNEYRRIARADRLIDEAGSALWLHEAADVTSDETLEVRSALRELAEEDRELLYMAYWEDLSRPEIAAILGISPGAVRVRLTRAKQRFKARLRRQAMTSSAGEEAQDGRD